MNDPPPLCRLQDLANRIEACPGSACPFWEEGGAAVLGGGCVFARLPLSSFNSNPDLVQYLLELRRGLDRGGGVTERGDWDRFYRLRARVED